MRHVTHSNQMPVARVAALPRPKFCITEMSMFALLALVGAMAVLLWAMIAAVL